MYEFRWNEWNIDHIAIHGVDPEDAEFVVNHARRPYPELARNDTFLVRGQTAHGECLQVVYFIDVDDLAYVIHARPLTDNERRSFRRRI
jgi:uncharacterized DUF497 family protein